MSFGPELSVAYVGDLPNRADQVRLASYIPGNAKVMFQQMQDDPAIEFLGRDGQYWQEQGPDFYINTRVERDDTAAWGVWRDDEQVGVAELFRYPNDVVSYAVMLRADSRDRGMGSLVTAALVHVAFEPNILAEHFDGFSAAGASSIITKIHDENYVSLGMCTKFGFIANGLGTSPLREYFLPPKSQICCRALADYRVQVL